MTDLNPAPLFPLISNLKENLKSNKIYLDLAEEYHQDPNIIDYVPITFGDLDVSARTNKGIIYLNYSLLPKPEEISGYLIHELTHWFQQCLGAGPTKGSTDDDYLDNPYEIDAFNTQTKYISDTKSDEAAEKYVEKVLDHHEVPQKERPKRKDQLLELAQQLPELSKEAGLVKVPMDLFQEMSWWAACVIATMTKIKTIKLIQDIKHTPPEISEKNLFLEEIKIALNNFNLILQNRYEQKQKSILNLPKPYDYFNFSITISPITYEGDEYNETLYEYNIVYANSKNKVIKNNIPDSEIDNVLNKFEQEAIIPARELMEELNSDIDELDSYHLQNYFPLIKECEKYPDMTEELQGNLTHAVKSWDKLGLSGNRIFLNLITESTTKQLGGPKEPWQAYWQHDSGGIVVKISDKINNVFDLNKTIKNTIISIRHELQHATQSTKQRIYKTKEWFGLPSKKIRTKEYDIFGNPFQTSSNPNSQNRLEHSLRDVEFYTNLTDEVSLFNLHVAKKYPPIICRLAAKKIVGLPFSTEDFIIISKLNINDTINLFRKSYFFLALERQAPEKWKKAIKEFFKAIDI